MARFRLYVLKTFQYSALVTLFVGVINSYDDDFFNVSWNMSPFSCTVVRVKVTL